MHFAYACCFSNHHRVPLLYAPFPAEAAHANFSKVRMAHIILFVMNWVLALMFLITMFRPFIRRTTIEARQVAELLSQLPPEMDVEGLVASAMTSTKRKGERTRGMPPGYTAPGLPSAYAQSENEAVTL